MLGLFGDSVIGTDHLTGPVSDSEDKRARFARHELVRGKPVLQDLGNDAGTKRFSFFFDEVFCDPEAELRKIERAFQRRTALRLFFDLSGFEINDYVIESLKIERQETTPKGRMVRVELDVELIESDGPIASVGAAIAGSLRAALSPVLKRLL